MEHESFENAATAALMNERFVNIKVDREERPDLDGIYMQAVQAMTGHGGWPMTMFLTPEGVPFYGGTYFPKEDRHGMPSFTRILHVVSDAYRSKPDEVARTAASVREMYAAATAATRHASRAAHAGAARRRVPRVEPNATTRRMAASMAAPKFPQTMSLDFLLRYSARRGVEHARAIATHSFRQMARGGIYDQIGGGFARYAVDACVARAALREDALRQRAARAARRAPVAGDKRRRGASRRRGDDRLGMPRAPRAGRRLLLVVRRRQRRPRRQVLRLERAGVRRRRSATTPR